ncbi:MAG: 30S ribosomal protein S18 [bacterium]
MPKRKKCILCEQKIDNVDYKRVDLLKNFISERYTILSRNVTKNCARHQRMVANAIKRARILALIPFVPSI